MRPKSCSLSIVLVGALSLLAPGDARAADFGFSVGTDLSAVNVVGGSSFSNLGTRIGVREGRAMPALTVDYLRVEVNEDFTSPDFDSTGTTVGLATVGLGGRFWLQAPDAEAVTPYVAGTGFTVIPHVNSRSEREIPSEGSSWGALAGFGADYWFTDAFAIGGELGAAAFFGSLSTVDSTISGSIVQMYTAVELSYFPWADD